MKLDYWLEKLWKTVRIGILLCFIWFYTKKIIIRNDSQYEIQKFMDGINPNIHQLPPISTVSTSFNRLTSSQDKCIAKVYFFIESARDI